MKPFIKHTAPLDEYCNNPNCEKGCGRKNNKPKAENVKAELNLIFTILFVFLTAIISFNAGMNHLESKYKNQYEGYIFIPENDLIMLENRCKELEEEVSKLKPKAENSTKKLDLEPKENITEKVKVEKGVLKRSNATEEMLKKGVHKELKNHVKSFLKAEEETGINAYFLCALAGYESGWGTSSLAKNNNNLFGYKGGKGYAKFSSKEECILFVAQKLKENYLTPEGKYFNGYEVKDIAIKYNHGSKIWIENIVVIQSQIENRAKA